MISRDKISLRQLILLYITIVLSPAIRLLAPSAAKAAHQSGWLSPVAAILPLIPLIYLLSSFFKKNKGKSLAELFDIVLGKATGKALSIIYILYTSILAATYLRYLLERLLGTIYPLVNQYVIIVSILAVAAYVLRSGLTVIAKMNEIILPATLIAFSVLILLLLPTSRLDFVTPVIARDWPGIFTGSISSIAIYSYITLMFFAGNHVNDKGTLHKTALKGFLVASFFSAAATFVIIANLGFRVVERTPLPFVVAVKMITFLDIIEKLESVVVIIWLFNDFILICAMSFIVLNLIKGCFGLQDMKPLINVYLILIGILTPFLAANRLEMQLLSGSFLEPANIVLFIGIPVLIFIIGKIRGKI